MPKEHIYDPTPRGRNVETDELMPEEPRRLSVAWSRDRYVQVGVGWVDSKLDVKDLPVHQQGFSPDYVQPTEADDQGRVWQSQWCDMNRHTINDLIRVLRRARDQAYGRDE